MQLMKVKEKETRYNGWVHDSLALTLFIHANFWKKTKVWNSFSSRKFGKVDGAGYYVF
jgi:hypothetical protein